MRVLLVWFVLVVAVVAVAVWLRGLHLWGVL